jgi:hypothetical protein
MNREIVKGSQDVTVYATVFDTSGDRKTGLAASAITCHYCRTLGSAVTVSMSPLASAGAAHAEGGCYEISQVALPGRYRLDLPDAAFASGADAVLFDLLAASAAPTGLDFVIVEPMYADLTKIRQMTCNGREIDTTDNQKDTRFADDGETPVAEITRSEPAAGHYRETVTWL